MDKIGKVTVDQSDLQKILDILVENAKFHIYRDNMNSVLHLAKETRWSPLTSETISARDRLEAILNETTVDLEGK